MREAKLPISVAYPNDQDGSRCRAAALAPAGFQSGFATDFPADHTFPLASEVDDFRARDQWVGAATRWPAFVISYLLVFNAILVGR